MAQEERNTSRCSNSSSGGGGSGKGGGGGSNHRPSKKLKIKKVPQRGMGVAQLEKIISEEQQKKDVAVLTTNLNTNSIIPPSNLCTNLASIQKIPNFRQPPPLPHSHHPLALKTDVVNNLSGPGSGSGSGLVSKVANVTGGVGNGGNWSRLWGDGDYSFEGEKQHGQNQNHVLDHTTYTNLGSLPYESNPSIWPPPPNLMIQRSQPVQVQQPCSSSMVNVSAGTSSSPSSSVMSFQIEPPSNQSYSGNFQPLWPEEDKMVGMKRPYPFSLENAPIPSFHCKFPSAYVSPIPRSDDPASCSNGGTHNIDATHHVFRCRDNSSRFGVLSDTPTKNFIDENQGLTRDFLKLAPPQASQSQLSSKEKLSSLCIGEQPQFETLPPHNGHSKEAAHVSGRSGSNPQPFISFFPAMKTPMGHPGNSNGEAGESVDLNLKL